MNRLPLLLVLPLFAACELFDAPSSITVPPSAAGSGLAIGDDASGDGDEFGTGPVLGPDGLAIAGGVIGAECSGPGDCRVGLDCVSSACAPTPTQEPGEPCVTSGECVEGTVCGISAQCGAPNPAPDGTAGGVPAGSACTFPQDCQPGLRCTYVGLAGVCEPNGTADIGQSCATSSECLSPLMCSARGQCEIPVRGGFAFMPPATCPDPAEDTGPFRSYFSVPRPGSEEDFFRLPFPNDIRRTENGVDLSDFHNPGERFIGGDVLDSYLAELTSGADGFSTNPTVYFRFSKSPSFNSITGGEAGSVRLVNITRDSPRYGSSVSTFWSITSGRGRFICDNYLSFHPAWGSPLEPNTTYAVYLTDGIVDEDRTRLVADADFAAVIGASRPEDSALGAAWDTYSPFREFLADQGILTSQITNAAVFTTGDPVAAPPKLRASVRALPAPALEDLRACTRGGSDDDACASSTGAFTELHATAQAPIFQRGTRPYLTREEGGDVVFEGGSAVVQGTEDLRILLTVPEGDVPEAGWPVLIYAHGTGGDFRSGVSDASVPGSSISANGSTVKFMVLSYDGVQHGPRRGDSTLEPEPLFFNFANPKAARGNVQQGIADLFFMTYLAEQIDVDAATSPTGRAFKADPAQIHFFGHSQGSTVGVPFAAFEPSVKASIFSGAGGSLALSLLNKTKPVDIARGVKAVLSGSIQTSNSVTDLDPVLSLLQWYTDPVDALNYGPLFFRRPVAGRNAMSVFQTYGISDSFAPEKTMAALVSATQLPQATPSDGDTVRIDGTSTIAFPVSGNKSVAGATATGLAVSYATSGFDGHFVAQRNSNARRQTMEFLATSVLSGIPTVSQ
jgi:hypothetical protein